MGGGESGVETSERGGKEKNSNETRRRRQAEALSECPHMVNFWMCNQKKKKKKILLCAENVFTASLSRASGESSRICVRHQTHSVCLVAPLGLMITPVGWAGIKKKNQT